MNGEPYRADEFGFACLRTNEAFVSASDFVAPADCWGDVRPPPRRSHRALWLAASQKAYSNGAVGLPVGQLRERQRGAALLALPFIERG